MDNHFVPNLTFGAMVCQSLRNYGIMASLDVHLMVTPPERMIAAFAKAGATYITIHAEATDNITASLQTIKNLGCQTGLSIKPNTPVSCTSTLPTATRFDSDHVGRAWIWGKLYAHFIR